jgi:hypothetical protein
MEVSTPTAAADLLNYGGISTLHQDSILFPCYCCFSRLFLCSSLPIKLALSKCLEYPCVVFYPHLFCLVYAIGYLCRLTHKGNTERVKADPAMF